MIFLFLTKTQNHLPSSLSTSEIITTIMVRLWIISALTYSPETRLELLLLIFYSVNCQ